MGTDVYINLCISCFRLVEVPKRGLPQCEICLAENHPARIPTRVSDLKDVIENAWRKRDFPRSCPSLFQEPPRRPYRFHADCWSGHDALRYWYSRKFLGGKTRPSWRGYTVKELQKKSGGLVLSEFWDLCPLVVQWLNQRNLDPRDPSVAPRKWLEMLATDGRRASVAVSAFVLELARRPFHALWYIAWAESWLHFLAEEVAEREATAKVITMANANSSVRKISARASISKSKVQRILKRARSS